MHLSLCYPLRCWCACYFIYVFISHFPFYFSHFLIFFFFLLCFLFLAPELLTKPLVILAVASHRLDTYTVSVPLAEYTRGGVLELDEKSKRINDLACACGAEVRDVMWSYDMIFFFFLFRFELAPVWDVPTSKKYLTGIVLHTLTFFLLSLNFFRSSSSSSSSFFLL